MSWLTLFLLTANFTLILFLLETKRDLKFYKASYQKLIKEYFKLYSKHYEPEIIVEGNSYTIKTKPKKEACNS